MKIHKVTILITIILFFTSLLMSISFIEEINIYTFFIGLLSSSFLAFILSVGNYFVSRENAKRRFRNTILKSYFIIKKYEYTKEYKEKVEIIRKISKIDRYEIFEDFNEFSFIILNIKENIKLELVTPIIDLYEKCENLMEYIDKYEDINNLTDNAKLKIDNIDILLIKEQSIKHIIESGENVKEKTLVTEISTHNKIFVYDLHNKLLNYSEYFKIRKQNILNILGIEKSVIVYQIEVIALSTITPYLAYRIRTTSLYNMNAINLFEVLIRVILEVIVGILAFLIASNSSKFLKNIMVKFHLFFWIFIFSISNILYYFAFTIPITQISSFIIYITSDILNIMYTIDSFNVLTGFYLIILVSRSIRYNRENN